MPRYLDGASCSCPTSRACCPHCIPLSSPTHPSPPPNAPDPVRLADTSILEGALAAAGFRDVTIERLIVTFEFPSPDAFADFRGQIGGTRAMLSKMPAEVARQVRDAVVSGAREHAV